MLQPETAGTLFDRGVSVSTCRDARRREVMPGDSRSFPVETINFEDDGVTPNNPVLPLVLYRGALGDAPDRAGRCEAMFDRNGWPGAWRNGIYAHHHYHSTAHEVL